MRTLMGIHAVVPLYACCAERSASCTTAFRALPLVLEGLNLRRAHKQTRQHRQFPFPPWALQERVSNTQRIMKQLKREEKRVIGLTSSAGSLISRHGSHGSMGSNAMRMAASGPALSVSQHTRTSSNDTSTTSRTSRLLSHMTGRRPV